MRARRKTALTSLAGLAGAFVAAAVLGAPTNAQAAPEAAYPAPAPAILVSAASVVMGDAVRVKGRGFAAGEPIAIHVQYRITPNSGHYDNPFGVSVHGDRRADDQGRFTAGVRLGMPGYAVIQVTGKRSGKTVRAAVRVQAWQSPWGDAIFNGTPLGSGPARGHWDGGDRPAGFFGPYRSGWSPFRLSGNDVAAPAPRQQPAGHAYGADVLPALLGLTALAGSALFTFRRRRPSRS
jgi:hypothetical protein